MKKIKLIQKTTMFLFLSLTIYFTYLIFNNSPLDEFEEKYNLNTLMKQTRSEKITGEKIQLEIQNGCGIKGAANLFMNFLRDEGYDVINTKNALDFNYNQTIIKIHKPNKGNFVEEISELLQIDSLSIHYDYNNNIFYDLTLIIGKDYQNLQSFKDVSMHHNPF